MNIEEYIKGVYGIFFIFYLKIKVKIESVNLTYGSYLWILWRWYDEVKDFPAANVESFSTAGAGATIGHYTQMVWGDTGKSLSEAFIFASTNPQCDNRLFIELQVQYMKIPN